MPQIGWLEILIIVSIAIIFIGPKDFPYMLKKVGSWIGSIKRYVNTVQNQVNVLDEDVLSEDLNNHTENKEKDKVDKK